MRKQKSFDKLNKSGKLYLVPTPIGNLEDMTFRGLACLKEADVIASEDTRNTQKLLNHFEIKTPQVSFHEHNVAERVPKFLERLKAGESIAQVSDAGMPSISDPGHELVVACIEEDIPVVSLPGATAGVTALIASGLKPDKFTFYGFLPRKKSEQVKRLEEVQNEEQTMIFYESPHRIKATVQNIVTVMGTEKEIVICRELTKIHEEYLRGTAAEILSYLEETKLKGECCLLVAGVSKKDRVESAIWLEWTINEHVKRVIEADELTSKEAIKQVAKIRQIKKQDVYREYHEL